MNWLLYFSCIFNVLLIYALVEQVRIAHMYKKECEVIEGQCDQRDMILKETMGMIAELAEDEAAFKNEE